MPFAGARLEIWHHRKYEFQSISNKICTLLNEHFLLLFCTSMCIFMLSPQFYDVFLVFMFIALVFFITAWFFIPNQWCPGTDSVKFTHIDLQCGEEDFPPSRHTLMEDTQLNNNQLSFIFTFAEMYFRRPSFAGKYCKTFRLRKLNKDMQSVNSCVDAVFVWLSIIF